MINPLVKFNETTLIFPIVSNIFLNNKKYKDNHVELVKGYNILNYALVAAFGVDTSQ